MVQRERTSLTSLPFTLDLKPFGTSSRTDAAPWRWSVGLVGQSGLSLAVARPDARAARLRRGRGAEFRAASDAVRDAVWVWGPQRL